MRLYLIVDDIDINLFILKTVIGKVDPESIVTTALSGSDALDKYNEAVESNYKFDIIITDFHMPEMTGHELAENLRNHEIPYDGTIAILTSDDTVCNVNRIKEVDHYMQKPITKQMLINVLNMFNIL